MMAWVDHATYMERLWAPSSAQSRLFIDELQLREGFEKASNSIRARGGWNINFTEFELEMREEPEEGLWLTAKDAHAGARLVAGAIRLWSECSSSVVLSSGVRHPSSASSVVLAVACSASDLARACRPVTPGAPG